MSEKSARDLLGSASGSVVVWLLPIGAMLLAIPLSDAPKTVIWLLALVWTGGPACSTPGGAVGSIAATPGPFYWR